jgi:signal transduction histidine kinase
LKLIQKTTRYYLTYIFLLLSMAAVLFYFLIRIVLIDSIDEGLKQEEEQMVNNFSYEKEFEILNPSANVIIERLDRLRDVNDKFSTVQVFDTVRNLNVDHRQLKSVFAYKGEFYQIIIRHSLEEAEILLQGLIPMVTILFLIILLGVYLMNYFLFRSLWEPFYGLLSRLKDYDINRSKVITYSHSDIQEFNELAQSVEKMTDKIYKDFIAQKEFNENSSHELQTPLAVMRNKLDLLIQSENLNESDLQLVSTMYESLKKLGNLNKGLILINKIENRQYHEKETVSLKVVINDILENFSDQISLMGIHVTAEISDYALIKSNQVIMEILITNLISNAVKHNIEKGELMIECTREYLKVENTGRPLHENPEMMFQRFRKNSNSPTSVGLGLAIVKKICDVFEYRIEYNNTDKWHRIRIDFEY